MTTNLITNAARLFTERLDLQLTLREQPELALPEVDFFNKKKELQI
ncbi:hypothetical protein ACFSL6_23150 [Paenibacillus thailandensis]|uniref:Uncharacterized protein n=1 Tax=Paenibacillus thailandensis TaxID=393250 RepID=A0ABW5QZ21_9BACL